MFPFWAVTTWRISWKDLEAFGKAHTKVFVPIAQCLESGYLKGLLVASIGQYDLSNMTLHSLHQLVSGRKWARYLRELALETIMSTRLFYLRLSVMMMLFGICSTPLRAILRARDIDHHLLVDDTQALPWVHAPWQHQSGWGRQENGVVCCHGAFLDAP